MEGTRGAVASLAVLYNQGWLGCVGRRSDGGILFGVGKCVMLSSRLILIARSSARLLERSIIELSQARSFRFFLSL